jgi:AraC-like DNA-binding protein
MMELRLGLVRTISSITIVFRSTICYYLGSETEDTVVSSAVRSFQDPWEHQAFYRGANMKVLVTGSGDYRSALTRIDLNRIWLQRNETFLPQVAHVAETENRGAIKFAADSQLQPAYRNGEELRRNAVVVSSIMGEHHWRMHGPSQIASMSMSPADLAAASQALIGRELTAPNMPRQIPASDPLIIRLRQLHAAACDLAAKAPDMLAHSEVAKAMDEELVRAMVGCLAEVVIVEGPTRSSLRMSVMHKFERAIEEADNQPLYVTDVCVKIGVQERTLRSRCLEYLGMGPHRYLWLRRMWHVRHALSVADPSKYTVTAIVANYGFWELGRFSVAYRKLFGENPSNTLRNSPSLCKCGPLAGYGSAESEGENNRHGSSSGRMPGISRIGLPT